MKYSSLSFEKQRCCHFAIGFRLFVLDSFLSSDFPFCDIVFNKNIDRITD